MQQQDVALPERVARVPRWVRSLLFAGAFVAAGLVGRATVVDGGTLALIWPAGGVGALWLMWSTWRQRLADLPLFALTVFGLNYATGAPLDLSLLFVVLNVGQSLAFVTLLDRWCPRIDGARGRSSMSSNRQVGRFLAVASVAALTGVTIGALGLLMLIGTGQTPGGAVLWWGRQLAGIVVVAMTAQLVWHAWRTGTLFRGRSGPAGRGLMSLEIALLVVGSVILYAVVFSQSSLPLAFLPAIASVWAGLRLSPAWTALHGSAGSALVIGASVAGTGPFSLATESSAQAGLAQLLVATLMFIGLSFSVAVETSENAMEVLRDEQERTRAEAARAEAQTRLLTTINETLEDALVVVGPDGGLVTRNASAERLLATDGFTDISVGDATRVRPWSELLAMAVGGDLDRTTDVAVYGEDAQRRVLQVVARPWDPSAAGHADDEDTTGATTESGAVLVLSDVTLERAHRDELAGFAGVVAHDLRNPIGVVRGWADELHLQVEHGETDRESLLRIGTAIGRATERMEDLIGDLLSHAVSRDQALEVEALDVTALVHDVAAARGVTQHLVTTRMPPVVGDRTMVRQLLDNLVGNSLKYVAPGVTPHIEVTGLTRDGFVEVSLLDNGIGVPAESTRLIFQQFQRAHRVGYQGTGLGLAICRTIVERHGGQIGVEPALDGVGSRFWFSLPAAEEHPGAALAPQRRAPEARSAERP